MNKLKALAVASFLGLAVAFAQVPIKIGSLTQVGTAPGNSVLLITVPGVTNYIISIANLQAQITAGLGTTNVVISNAYITFLTTTNLLVLDTLTVKSNAYIGGTNFAAYLVVSNTAQFLGNIYVTGDGNFYNIWVTNNAFIGNALTVSNTISGPKTNIDLRTYVSGTSEGRGYFYVDTVGRAQWVAQGVDALYGGAYFDAIGVQEAAFNFLVSGSMAASNYITRWAARTNMMAFDVLNPANFAQIVRTPFAISGFAPDGSFLIDSNGNAGVRGFFLPTNGLRIPNFNALSNYVWTCTNTTTGEGEWRPSSGTGGLTNIGVLGTNIAYAAINMLDFSSPWNDYQMTNPMASHMTNWVTNLTQGASVSLSIVGTNAYTNWNVWFYWPPYATVTWLSLTNGFPETTITSNKLQFYSFLVRTNLTQTNVIASFKEQP